MTAVQRYRVTGHLATVTTGGYFAVSEASLGGSRTRTNIMQGKLLPTDVPANEIAHLLAVKMILPVGSASDPAEA